MAASTFWQPEEVLSRIQLGIDGVTEMDWLVNARTMTPPEAALQWMSGNRQRVDRWFV
jgi:glycine betaine/proline transport system substrate-binding protein